MSGAAARPGGWLNLALVLGAVVLAIGLLELLVRLLGMDYGVDHNWRYHDRYGWTQVPGARYQVSMQGLDFEVAFNQAGFRDRDHEIPKPPGVRRVVILGDSFSEAIQVPLAATWHQQLEQLLNDGQGRWEIINLGVGDFGTAQQLLLLDTALSYEPDLLIHQVFPLNDVCNNNIELAGQCRSHNDAYRPYARLTDGKLEWAERYPLRRWLRDRSLTWFVVERRLRWRDVSRADEDYWRERFRAGGYAPLDPMLWTFVPDAGDFHPEIERGWALTEALIKEITSRARAEQVAYLALVVPFEARVGANWPRFQARRVLAGAPRAMDGAYPERRLGSLYDALGVQMVALRPHLATHFDEVMPYWGGHLSPPGHRLAAEVLESAVRAALAPAPTPEDG